MKRLACAALALVFTSSTALAGGIFLPLRSTRSAGRGGAFTAGADDPSAIWFNPAGLAQMVGAVPALLVDLAYVGQDMQYTRVDSGGNPQPQVDNDQQFLPIPAIAAAFAIGKRTVLGIGFAAPYAALNGFPEDGPQRYQLVTLHGSAFGVLAAGIGVRVKPWLTVGGALQNLIFAFRSRVVFSACPREIVCAPEDPEFDSLGEIEGHDFVSPSALLGVQIDAGPRLRFGAAVQAPFFVAAGGEMRVRLPASGFYGDARIAGDRGEVRMTIPAMIRLGVQATPIANLRLELGVDWEMWSMHDKVTISPQGVRVEDAPGVGIYELGELRIPRGLNDTLALRLGAEARVSARVPITLRAGYVFETGSTPDEFISVFAPDTRKHVLTVGLAWDAPRFRVDASFARVFQAGAEVAPGESCLPQLNPIRSGQAPMPDGEPCIHDDDPSHVYVGDGSYQSGWTVFGVGVAVKL